MKNFLKVILGIFFNYSMILAMEPAEDDCAKIPEITDDYQGSDDLYEPLTFSEEIEEEFEKNGVLYQKKKFFANGIAVRWLDQPPLDTKLPREVLQEEKEYAYPKVMKSASPALDSKQKNLGAKKSKSSKKGAINDGYFIIEKIVAEREYKGKIQVKVKWLGYDNRYNKWIFRDDIEIQ